MFLAYYRAIWEYVREVVSMFIEESLWIKNVLEDVPLPEGATVLDIGSSTRDFRETIQPYIGRNVFFPLRQRGMIIHHLDVKEDDGVDIVCDITDENSNLMERIGRTYDLVLCTNLLEHVTNVRRTIATVRCLVKTEGYLIVTVPYSYRKHDDPIDTMFRPSPQEIVDLFCENCEYLDPLVSEVVRIADRSHYKRGKGKLPLRDYREYVRYYFKALNWKQSCALFKHL